METLETAQRRLRRHTIAWGGCAVTSAGFVLLFAAMTVLALPAIVMMIAGVIMTFIGVARATLSPDVERRPAEDPAVELGGATGPVRPGTSWPMSKGVKAAAANPESEAVPPQFLSRASLAIPLVLALLLCYLLFWLLSHLGKQ